VVAGAGADVMILVIVVVVAEVAVVVDEGWTDDETTAPTLVFPDDEPG